MQQQNTGLLGPQAGQALDWLGTALHLPEAGWSEGLAGGNTANTYNYQAATGNTAGPVSPNYYNTYNTFGPGPQTPLVSPQVKGQPVGQNVPSGQILGTQTSVQQTQTSGGGGTGGGSLRDQFNAYRGRGGYAGWGEPEAWADFQAHPEKAGQGAGGNGQPQSSWGDMLNDAYAQTTQPLYNWLNALPGQRAEMEQNILGQQGANQQSTEEQRQLQLQNLENQINQFNTQAQGTQETANRLYNVTAQNALNRFGGGEAGGLGPAAQQAILQQGEQNMNQLNVNKQQAQSQFVLATRQANQFFDQQNRDLTTQANDALTKVKLTFQDQANSINAQIGQAGTQKTNAMIGLLQNTINAAQQVTQTYNTNRLKILSDAANYYSTVMANKFQAPDMSRYFAGLQQAMPEAFKGPAQVTDVSQGMGGGGLFGFNRDQLRQLGLV